MKMFDNLLTHNVVFLIYHLLNNVIKLSELLLMFVHQFVQHQVQKVLQRVLLNDQFLLIPKTKVE